MGISKRAPLANSLLAALPRKDSRHLVDEMEQVVLNYGEVLYEPGEQIGHVYFPNDCIVSLLTLVDQHQALEVGLVGREGMVGIPLALEIRVSPVRALVQGTGPALVFDELSVKGVATPDDADLGEIRARLYGGTVTGKTTVSWRKGVQLAGAFDVHQLELKQVAALFPSGARFSGKLNAKPVFSASANSADQIVNALRLETPFDVQNGALQGVDIEKAAANLIKQGTTGGETRFEALSGHLVMERGGYRFTELKIASGALAADGNVSLSAKKELSGRINAQIKAAGTSANVPLNVAGTLDSPLLYPTAGTLAGAAVGTAILGPGVGTSVGAKVGGWAEGLFGKKEKKAPKK